PRPGMEAEVPPMDPRALLTMTDMGMAHDMSGMGGMKGMDHGSMPGMGHDMSDMSGMQHEGSSGASNDSMQGMDHDMANMEVVNHGGMELGHERGGPPVHHAPAEYGPTVDSLAMQPQSRLDDPGVGLRNNGRRVLTYADLRTLGGPIDHRDAG